MLNTPTTYGLVLDQMFRIMGKCFVLQVWSVLESLDRDYKRDEDWCGTERANISDKPSYMVQLINKHNEQKEAFLKVATHKQSC